MLEMYVNDYLFPVWSGAPGTGRLGVSNATTVTGTASLQRIIGALLTTLPLLNGIISITYRQVCSSAHKAVHFRWW